MPEVVRTFLIITLLLRTALCVLGFAISVLFLLRSYANGPVTTALVFYFFANTFAMSWYVLANYETWFLESFYMQTFGLVVWIPLTLTEALVFSALWHARRWRH